MPRVIESLAKAAQSLSEDSCIDGFFVGIVKDGTFVPGSVNRCSFRRWSIKVALFTDLEASLD